jgi:hypothetical protein
VDRRGRQGHTGVPGTSASKLTCLSEFLAEFSFFLSGVDGDRDMAVTDYTRLAHLLYAVRDSRVGLDVAAALEVLNLRFLTLRSSDEQGAMARESYNLLFSCGNLPNQFGSAVDTRDGNRCGSGTRPVHRGWPRRWKTPRSGRICSAPSS